MPAVTSKDKLKELIVYISSKCGDDIKFGKTKLNKILFWSDFLYYFKRRKAITGHNYVKLPYGPIPNDIETLLKEMEANKDIGLAILNAGPYKQTKLVALREPNLGLFDADMIAHVDSIIEDVCGEKSYSATQLSDGTHQTMGWIVTDTADTIPYQTIFVKHKRYQKANVWNKKRAKEIASLLQGQYGFPQTT